MVFALWASFPILAFFLMPAVARLRRFSGFSRKVAVIVIWFVAVVSTIEAAMVLPIAALSDLEATILRIIGAILTIAVISWSMDTAVQLVGADPAT
jgi:hypothetical protein